MAAARKKTTRRRRPAPDPPLLEKEAIIHGDQTTILPWLVHYWQKLQLPEYEMRFVALTQDRREFMQWTGKRVNLMILGCYCYLPYQPTPKGWHRHVIFIEPDMQPKSIEVTIAHELIHLADRFKGTPRRHRHHGYDAIAIEEAALTGYDIEELRALLHEESARREAQRRARRPFRYLYECPNCGKKYPRTRKYSKAVSCSSCDKSYNPEFKLLMSRI